MGLLLDMSPRALEKVLYFASYVVIDPGPEDTTLSKKQLLSENEYREAVEKYGNNFLAMMGAEGVKKLLEEIDLNNWPLELKKEIEAVSGQRRCGPSAGWKWWKLCASQGTVPNG